MADKLCKDCVVEFSEADKVPMRPAPYPGPRCATHHREARKGRKEMNHAAYVARTYSITAERYAELYEAQGGTCAICQRATGASRKLSVDHDHKCCNGSTSCGECVRGLLCRPCNDLLGHGRDDIQFFGRAIAYLADPPAKRVKFECCNAPNLCGGPHEECYRQKEAFSD
jgi:hypothetical protein